MTSGEIIILDQPFGDGKRIPQNLGAIIEVPEFLPNCSGFRNFSYLMALCGYQNNARICNVMDLVGLNPKSKKHVRKYSIGMRQRLGIAQSIMENQKLLVLHESMNGLEKSGVDDIRSLLLKYKLQGKTILLASHNPDDVRILCDAIYEMDNGCLTRIKRFSDSIRLFY